MEMFVITGICGSIILLWVQIIRLEMNIRKLKEKTMEHAHKYDEKFNQIYHYIKDHKHE